MTELERAIPAQKLAKIFARLADLDIKKAGLENVHGCPHCDFQIEIANPDEKLFKCQNPECMRETCLLCKEPNHIPLRCEEVEKSNVTDYRKKVEEAMTASLVRTCPKCKAKFFKTEGCNKMTCSCGAYVCYVCRELIKHKDGYNHFCQHDRGPREFGACPDCKKCFLFLKDTSVADQKLVDAAKMEATKEFAGDNVELAAVQVGAVEPPSKKGKKGKQPKRPAAAMPAMGIPMPFGGAMPFGVPNIAAFHQNLMGLAGRMHQMVVGGGIAGPAPPPAPAILIDHRGRRIEPIAVAAPLPPPVVAPDVVDLVAPDVIPAGRGLKRRPPGVGNEPENPIVVGDDDEAVARRMQDEFDAEARAHAENRRRDMGMARANMAQLARHEEYEEEEEDEDYDDHYDRYEEEEEDSDEIGSDEEW